MSKIGIVFSSGFFGFFAHAGFLSALRKKGINASGYSGASSGAILAAMAAANMSDNEINKILFKVRKRDFWDPDPFHILLRNVLKFFRGYGGYLNGRKFSDLLKGLPSRHIEECDIPLAIAATNLSRKCETIFRKGDLVKAVCASGAVPILFKPIEIDGELYIDGGMVNKAPVLALADMIRPDIILVHYIGSYGMDAERDGLTRKSLTPWHIHQLSVNISRHAAYERQCEIVRKRGIEIIEINTHTQKLGPSKLKHGPKVYKKAREMADEILEKFSDKIM